MYLRQDIDRTSSGLSNSGNSEKWVRLLFDPDTALHGPDRPDRETGVSGPSGRVSGQGAFLTGLDILLKMPASRESLAALWGVRPKGL